MATSGYSGMKSYIGIWIALLAIVAVEVFLAYRDVSVRALLAMLLILAFLEAGIGVMYFMHLKYEKRRLLWSLGLVVFVLLMMNQIWPDAYRMANIALR